MNWVLDGLNNALAQGSFLAFFLAFLGGIFVSFEPCIYTMLPITVTFIASQSSGKKLKGFTLSLVYVLGLALIYTLLGAIAALSGKVFGLVSASAWPNTLMGIVCILLSLSMFDIYEIRMPGFINNLASKKIGSGYVTVFFLGLISGLVVGPCTGAVLGALLFYVGKSGNIAFGTGLLFVFSLGMGVLLIIAGTFAGLLLAIPKPGPWMQWVRRTIGAILFLAGLSFLYHAWKFYH